MIIRSVELANFRKFREPFRVAGFTDGLNVVVEPNETGKSTLLEALRAALFIRYSAKTELVRSYVPLGDEVAPRVSLEFALGDQTWTLEKQFMKSPSVRLTGEGRRWESDAAEEKLQELLGFERGNNRGSDNDVRGPLGMLWVEQRGALDIMGPNRIVRESVRSVLEAEVGAVTGGRRFDAIRSNIESAYALVRTPASGKSKGALQAAEIRLTQATAARQQAETSFREYEQALNDLETARARLRIVERDLADPETAEERRKLTADLKVAETTSLRLAAAIAEHGQADELAKSVTARLARFETAEARVNAASSDIETKRSLKSDVQTKVDQAAADEKQHRATLEGKRKLLEAKQERLADARSRWDAFTQAAGAQRAIDARQALAGLEARERALIEDASLTVGQSELDELAALERDVVTALARFEAGAVKVDIEITGSTEVRIDGEASKATSVDVLAPTRFDIGDYASIVVRPPHSSGRSLGADLAAAREELSAKLGLLDLVSHAAGVARNERAASAGRELIALRTQIAAACPGDPTIGLAPGADSLRAYVTGLRSPADDVLPPEDDLSELEKAVTAAKLDEVAAAATHEEARSALAAVESLLASAESDLGAANRELDTANSELAAVLQDGDRANFEAAVSEAQRVRAGKLELLEQARESAEAFDIEAIKRRLANLDRAANRGSEERLELTGRIASLESTTLREGTVGPAGQVAEAKEEERAATAAVDRLRREADTLEMLRNALTEAANEASKTFLAPVTQRAARYVKRLLPGCDLSFNEGFELAGVSRAGLDESCNDLSQGTQEQLAILTRLAFADLLLEDGAPISLILDDPLVYSDDARLELMTDILEEASQRMQVIMLTCRSKAFRHVDGNRITLK